MNNKRQAPTAAKRPDNKAALDRATSGSPPARSVSQEIVEFSTSFSGPLPPPQTLAQYNSAFPDAAERIMKMAETQSAHRQSLEKARVHADIHNEKLGQWFAFILALVVFIGGVLLVWQGKNIAGITLLIAEIATLVGLFIYGKESKRRELERRRQELLESALEDEA
jgi:uncharacterized membrane protein